MLATDATNDDDDGDDETDCRTVFVYVSVQLRLSYNFTIFRHSVATKYCLTYVDNLSRQVYGATTAPTPGTRHIPACRSAVALATGGALDVTSIWASRASRTES